MCLREATPPRRLPIVADLVLSEHAGRASHERNCGGTPLLRVQLRVVPAGCPLVQPLKQHKSPQKQVASAAGPRANLCMWLGNAAQNTLSPASTAETDGLIAAYLDDKVASDAATSTNAASAEAPVPPAAASAASATTPHVSGEGGACRVRLDLAVQGAPRLRPHRRVVVGAAPRRKPPDYSRLLTEAAEFMGPAATAANATTSFSTAAAGSSSELFMPRPRGLAWSGPLLAPRTKRCRDGHNEPHGASGAGAAAGAQPGGADVKQPVAATVQQCAFSASGTLGRGLSAAAASVSGDPTIQRIAEFVMRHGGPVTALAGWTVLTKTRNGSCREKGHLRRVWISPDGERLYSMRKVWPHLYAFRMR